MPLTAALTRLRHWTDRVPLLWRHGLAVSFVVLAVLLRLAATHLWPTGGFLFFLWAIGCAAALGRGGAGYTATGLSTLLAAYFIPPIGHFAVAQEWVLPMLVFMGLGLGMTALVQSLHHALDQRERMVMDLWAMERRRELLLTEYRHRTRNDLMGVSAWLMLRARHVVDPVARQAMREAATHTVTLGRIHARLERAQHDRYEVAVVDTAQFLSGVCQDLTPPLISVSVVRESISTERGVSLGLLLNELVAEARRDGAILVEVTLGEVNGDFLLAVTDDRPRLGEIDPLRRQLAAILTKQLRGKLCRTPGQVCCRFPIAAPSLAPGKVGV
jgi:two-component sensor histidine kinase